MIRPRWFSIPIASLMLATLSYAPLGCSEQIRFNRNGGQYQYQWNDGKEQEHRLDFTIQGYPYNLSQFTRFTAQQANQYVLRELQREISTLDPSQVQASVALNNSVPRVSVTGRDQERVNAVLDQLMQKQDQALTDFLSEIHYIRDIQLGGKVVLRPDYKEIASQSAPYIKNIMESISEANPEVEGRDQLELLLNFIQNIPYKRLESFGDNRSSGFMTPIQVLRYNMGDCDSKSTLMASAIITAYPYLQVEMIYLPNHALLALAIPPQREDKTLTVKGRQLVLLEPTGPANILLGQADPASIHYIDTNMYHSETIHPSQ